MADLSTTATFADVANRPVRSAAVRVWDPVVRVFYWATVIGCILNRFVIDESSVWHLYIGYVVATLFESVHHRENLVWSMATGRKRP